MHFNVTGTDWWAPGALVGARWEDEGMEGDGYFSPI